MKRKYLVTLSCAAGLALLGAVGCSRQEIDHATVGVLETVEPDGKNLVVATPDGLKEVFSAERDVDVKSHTDAALTETPAAPGVPPPAPMPTPDREEMRKLSELQGDHVIVRYKQEGARKEAVKIDHFGRNALHQVRGALVEVADDAEEIVLRSAAGQEERFGLDRDPVVVAGTSVIDAEDLEKQQGRQLIVYYMADGEEKQIRFVRVDEGPSRTARR